MPEIDPNKFKLFQQGLNSKLSVPKKTGMSANDDEDAPKASAVLLGQTDEPSQKKKTSQQ